MSAALFGAPGPARVGRVTLLALVVLAASIRMYLSFSTAPTHAVLDPENILHGRSLAPNQYRILAPLLCAALRALLGDFHEADEVVQALAIVACNAAIVAVLLRETESVELSSVGLAAFVGATANTMAWRNRETFLEVLFAIVGFAIVTRPRPRWAAFAALSLLGALNRETWAFVLTGAAAARVAAAGGARRLPRADVLGLAASGAIALAAFAGVRVFYGIKPYHTELWMMGTNISNLAPWIAPDLVVAKGVWTLGAGLGLAYLLSLARGARRHLPFIAGFSVPALIVSFLIASWYEPRIFTAMIPLLLVALLGAARPAKGAAG